MREPKRIDLGMTGYDELFMNDAERAENRLPKIFKIPLTEIDDFPDHPYQVRMDEDMDQLVESVKERGIITPITLRQKEDGRYEIVSGHRRKKACEIAGLDTVPSEIKELTRDEAIILMVDSNLQRSEILPSEKAFAYKMKMDAMKRVAGRPSKENYSPVDNNLQGVTSASIIAAESKDSQAQIFRYIRLTELVPELRDLVDEGKIAMTSLQQVLDMRIFDLMNMNGLNAVRVEEIITCLYKFLNNNAAEDKAMYEGTMSQAFDYGVWRKTHKDNSKITVSDIVLSEGMNLKALQHLYDVVRRRFFKSGEYNARMYRYYDYQEYLESKKNGGKY